MQSFKSVCSFSLSFKTSYEKTLYFHAFIKPKTISHNHSLKVLWKLYYAIPAPSERAASISFVAVQLLKQKHFLEAEWRARHVGVEMVLRREVHGAISVCSFAPSVPPYPWLRLHLGDVGTPPRQAISMASAQTEALDGRSEASTWITGKRTVLPLRPRARIHRPHRRVMLILSGDLVAHIYMSPSGDRKCS